MAMPLPLLRAVPALTREEAEALCLVDAYLRRAGTQVAGRPLGCPKPSREATLVAELGDALLRGAALCAGPRGLANADDHRLLWGVAMDAWHLPTLEVIGGWLLVAFVFVLREVVSGVR